MDPTVTIAEPWPPDALARAQDAMNRLHGELIRFGVQFSEWRPGGAIHHDARLRTRVLRGRDDISYRASSVLWHAAELNRHRRRVCDAFANKAVSLEALDAFPRGFDHYVTVNHHLFDDVVFNVQSMFDYLAALISNLRLPHRRLWGKLIADCRRKNPAIEPELSQALLAAHTTWVGNLEGYRGDLIHNEAQPGEGESSFSNDTLTMRWTVWIPQRLATRAAAILGADASRLEVADAASVIAQHAFAEVEHIIGRVNTRGGP